MILTLKRLIDLQVCINHYGQYDRISDINKDE